MGQKRAGDGEEVEFFSKVILQYGEQLRGEKENSKSGDYNGKKERFDGAPQGKEKNDQGRLCFRHTLTIIAPAEGFDEEKPQTHGNVAEADGKSNLRILPAHPPSLTP
jgi:hypothetical protein